jgi:hypothetical protein
MNSANVKRRAALQTSMPIGPEMSNHVLALDQTGGAGHRCRTAFDRKNAAVQA